MAAPRQVVRLILRLALCSRKLWNRIKLRSSLFLFVPTFLPSSTSNPISSSASFLSKTPFAQQTERELDWPLKCDDGPAQSLSDPALLSLHLRTSHRMSGLPDINDPTAIAVWNRAAARLVRETLERIMVR